MLHLIPAPLHRLALRIAYRLRNRWRRVTRNAGAGVSVIGVDEESRVLLVRHSYGSRRWALPGGGLGRQENPGECARREMREELGCDIEQLELVARFEEELFGGTHRAFVFTARLAGKPRPDGREVVEAAWFALDALPEDLVSFAHYRLRLAFPERQSPRP